MVHLNNKQKDIISDINGQSIIIACPGSGKTTTILARANEILKNNIEDRSLLIITFTKEAATHMQNKFAKEYKKDNNIRFGTIHSLCYEILQKTDGLQKENILRETEKWNFFYQYLQGKIKKNEMEEFVKNLISEISYVKNKMEAPLKHKCDICSKEAFYEYYLAYEEFKESARKIDFDDMLLKTREILLPNNDISGFYHNKYKYIMVDEYQDTNIVQADIIYSITGENGNLCVVGDDDQSIYGFRSADSTIMLDFKKTYPDAKEYYLETNYRSNSDIIKYASNLINHNKIRFKKEFKSSKNDKSTIRLSNYQNQSKQCENIIKEIKSLRDSGNKYEEMAILYRTNAENQIFAVKFLKENIPFYTTESIADYHNDTIFLDILTYYRLANGKAKAYDFISILNRPSRYLKTSDFKDCPFDKTLLIRRAGQLEKKDNAINQLTDLFCDLDMLKGKNPCDFIKYLFYMMKYKEKYYDYLKFIGKDESSAALIFNIIEEESKEFSSMEEWINFADLYAEKLKEKRRKKEGVCLSTYHSAKGLEWDNVFLINSNAGYIPYKKASTKEEIEEERRLYYVAITRARKGLYISYVTMSGSKILDKSPFVNELKLNLEEVLR